MPQRAVKKGAGGPRRAGRGATAARGGGRTREELLADAGKLGVTGRSRMNKQQLTRAIAAKKGAQSRRRKR